MKTVQQIDVEIQEKHKQVESLLDDIVVLQQQKEKINLQEAIVNRRRRVAYASLTEASKKGLGVVAYQGRFWFVKDGDLIMRLCPDEIDMVIELNKIGIVTKD